MVVDKTGEGRSVGQPSEGKWQVASGKWQVVSMVSTWLVVGIDSMGLVG